MSDSRLRNVSFRDSPMELPRMAEHLSIQHCTLDDVEFSGCTFHNTVLRGIKAGGLRLRNVDLTDRTLETEKDLRDLAGR